MRTTYMYMHIMHDVQRVMDAHDEPLAVNSHISHNVRACTGGGLYDVGCGFSRLDCAFSRLDCA